tara:strand:- start:39 stop:191 length:153 start_codon:yes stop_codon:yes gene_type:complete
MLKRALDIAVNESSSLLKRMNLVENHFVKHWLYLKGTLSGMDPLEIVAPA